jgi:hypothetical protein
VVTDLCLCIYGSVGLGYGLLSETKGFSGSFGMKNTKSYVAAGYRRQSQIKKPWKRMKIELEEDSGEAA